MASSCSYDGPMRVEDIRLTELTNAYFSSAKNWGCTCLDDGRYAITSFSSKFVSIMKSDGSLDYQIDTKPYSIIDIVYLPASKSVAITTGAEGKHRINIIDIDKKKIVRSLQVETKNFGITLHRDKLVYSAAHQGLMILDLEENTIQPIHIDPPMSDSAYVASLNDNLYYTHKYNHTVTCCDINGQTKWQFKADKVMMCPHGICVDGDGFVYVVCYNSNNVIVISPDGTHHAVLLTLEDGMYYPTAIDYDRNNNVLIVVNEGHKLFLYKVNK